MHSCILMTHRKTFNLILSCKRKHTFSIKGLLSHFRLLTFLVSCIFCSNMKQNLRGEKIANGKKSIILFNLRRKYYSSFFLQECTHSRKSLENLFQSSQLSQKTFLIKWTKIENMCKKCCYLIYKFKEKYLFIYVNYLQHSFIIFHQRKRCPIVNGHDLLLHGHSSEFSISLYPCLFS